MPRSRLLALFALLAVVVATALVLERLRTTGRPETSLLGISADEVVKIYVRKDKRELQAIRLGAAWHIEAPSVTRPDAPAAVAELVDYLAGLVPVDTFERQEIDGRAFGIEAPRARIELDVRGRAKQVVLLLGDYVPTGGSVYGVLAPERRIHQIGAGIVSEVDKMFYLTSPAKEPSGGER